MSSLSPEIHLTNSTSYADIVGLAFGLERLAGEDTISFMDRLYLAAASTRNHTYQGVVNELSFDLGLSVRPGATVACTDSLGTLSLSVSGLVLKSEHDDITIPLLTIDDDHVWVWRMLSEVVADINNTQDWSCTQLIDDVPGLQLAVQSNVITVVAQPVAGMTSFLGHNQVIVGSERFNKGVPSYTLSSNGRLSFTSEPVSGLEVSYQYRVLPYDLVCSEVAVWALKDSGMQTLALHQGVLVHQVHEAVHELAERDRSYWGK